MLSSVFYDTVLLRAINRGHGCCFCAPVALPTTRCADSGGACLYTALLACSPAAAWLLRVLLRVPGAPYCSCSQLRAEFCHNNTHSRMKIVQNHHCQDAAMLPWLRTGDAAAVLLLKENYTIRYLRLSLCGQTSRSTSQWATPAWRLLWSHMWTPRYPCNV